MKLKCFKFFLAIIVSLFAFQNFAAAQNARREIAFTIDDLPVVSPRKDLKTRQEITEKILRHLTKEKIPAIGFVNEGKLYTDNILDEAEVDLLRRWTRAGLELGNHTFSHLSLHANPLDKYEAEILKGETVTKELLKEKGKRMRYFRHPFLFTGLDLETKRKLSEFLAKHDYTIAPVTIDNDDWIFARAFDNAIDKNDAAMRRRVGEAYVPYLESKMDYWERQSVKLFGREVKQILLLHANAINAEYLDDIARMLKKRGYKFVALEDALRDEAYKLPDTFVRRAGISWLHRWALERGRENLVADEPKTPDFVMKEAGVE